MVHARRSFAILNTSKVNAMNANPKFLAATAHVDEAAVQPLPNSRKIYVQGSRPDIRVRRCAKSVSRIPPASFGAEKIRLSTYMTPRVRTSRTGRQDRYPLRPGRAAPAVDSGASGYRRIARPKLAIRRRAPERSETGRTALQPAPQAAPRTAWQKRVTDALRAGWHHHAGNGIRCDSRKHVPQGVSGKI